MNKEVIYLEPEDDITDILTKLQQAEQKVVALVPPKKASILRSAVNMKLVARVAKECEKVAVIVTADPAIVKMAMTAKIPVAKTLQSRPVVPNEENLKKAEALEDVIDEDILEGKKSDKKSRKSDEEADINNEKKPENNKNEIQLDEDSLEDAEAKDKAKQKAKKKAQKEAAEQNFFQKYRKWIFAGSFAAVILAVILVWAFVFAPAVKITVAISGTPNNFSENVRFTTDANAQNLEENLLFAGQITLDKSYKTDLSATGEEDRGEKATGRVTATVSFRPSEYMGYGGFGITIAVGERFKNESNGLTYIATSSDSKGWDGEEASIKCDNGTLVSGSGFRQMCQFSISVSVEAERGGEEYNIGANSNWSPLSTGNATVTNGGPIAGGTTKMVKVISEDDINKAKETLLAEHTIEGKEDILSDLGDDLIAIEASFKDEITEVKTSPEQGQEVKDGDKPSADIKITYSIYVVKKSTIEAYINSKTNVAEDQKIYSYGEPYFERFTDIENKARLKSTYETGPTVTKEDILEKVKGKKTGQVSSILKSINGVSSVNIETSYFWVWSVPNNPNKITIELVGEGSQE